MPLKTRDEYIASLRDGREIYWDGERIDDITTHPKFAVPIEIAARDYDYDDPDRRDIITYKTETGDVAHRIYQTPRTEEDLLARVELAHNISIVGGVTGVYMALLNVVDAVRQGNPAYGDNIRRAHEQARD